jgi:hypothetical protein
MKEYLDKLPHDLYFDLLKIYLIDFHLFGYDVPPPGHHPLPLPARNEN